MTALSDRLESERKLRGRISARGALSHIAELIEHGDRFVGTAGDRAAAEWVAARFEKLGLEVQRRSFTTTGYTGGDGQVVVGDLSLDGMSPYFGPATPDGGIEAPIVFAGNGDEDAYAGRDVAGKIVVIQEEGIGYARFWMGTFADLAHRKGALAVVVIHPLPWAYRMSMEAGNGDLSQRFCEHQVPVVCLSAIDGAKLMYAIGAGDVKATVTVDAATPEVESELISGVLRGSEFPDESILVHAHRDHGCEPGANDNGSGVGVMLEVAGAMAEERPRRTIEFLCTTAEEGVTPGIAAYIAAREREGTLEQLKATIDVDMIAVGGRLYLVDRGDWPDTGSLNHSDWLMRMMEDAASELGYDVGRMHSTWGIAESGRFLERGIPAIWFWKPDDPYYHSPHDSLDKLDGNTLKVVGDLVAVGLQRLSTDGIPPSK